MLYWADNFNKTISRAPMGNPGKVQVILNSDLKMLQGLDVDWIGRKIYWTDSGNLLYIKCYQIQVLLRVRPGVTHLEHLFV